MARSRATASLNGFLNLSNQGSHSFNILPAASQSATRAFSKTSRPSIEIVRRASALPAISQRVFPITTLPIALRRPVDNILRASFSSTARLNKPDTQSAPPRKRAGFFRWTWRIIQISVVGGIAYLSYSIYDLRHPADQDEPAPGKKTLVVLGTGWGSVSLLKKLDTENYNVIVISPRNYFLFTPLLPSCTTGTIEHRSIMEPIRNFLRHKKATVKYYEAEATKIDYANKKIYLHDESAIKGDSVSTEVDFDLLVVGVGAENATFGELPMAEATFDPPLLF